MRYWILVGLLSLLPCTIGAQSLHDNLVVRFENLTVSDRLPSERVLCVCQDQRGFMWFGTEEGLCRYDGHRFVEYFADIKDPYSLRNQAIRSIVEDRFGNLWIGTDGGGLHYFDQRTLKFYSYPLPYKPLDNSHSRPGFVYAILRTKAEEYWIGSYGQGLYKIPGYESPEELFSRCEDQDMEGIIQILPNGQGNGLNDLNVYCLYQDSNDDIWIGTDDYGTEQGGALHKLVNEEQEQVYSFIQYRSIADDPTTLGSNYIMSVYEDSKGRFWVCNWNGGLNLLDRETGKVRRFPGGFDQPGFLNAHDVYSITEDRNGILWLATYGGGISRILEDAGQYSFVPYTHEVNQPNSLIGDFVRQLFIDQGGLLWAITWKSGISRIRVNQNPFLQIPLPGHLSSDTVSEVVSDMRLLPDHSIGLYTEQQGYFKLILSPEESGYQFVPLSDPNDWPDRSIFQTRFARKYSTDRTFRNLIKDSRVYLEDSSGKLWFAKGQQLCRLSPSSDGGYQQEIYQRNTQDPTALKGYHVTAIAEDEDHQIWIATFDGLNLYQESTNNFLHYTMKDGLAGNAISAMLIDENNFLWLTTENGLDRFDPKYRGALNYTAADGMPFREFCARVGFGMEDFQVFPAFTPTGDGGMLFSSVQHGLLYFNPRDIFRDLTVPKTWITELRVMNKVVTPENIRTGIAGEDAIDIAFARSIILDPEENSFTFGISVIDYFNSGHTQFAYRLLPVDEDWRFMPPGVETVNYSMLPAGDYVFESRGANADGIWTDQAARVHIHMENFWYKEFWFRLLIGVTMLLILTIILIRSRQRNQIVQALSMEKLRREEQDRFTQMRLNFYTNVTHEFRTQLTLILGPLGKLERVLKDPDTTTDLKIMKRNGLRLLNLINQLMDYRKLEMRAMQLQVEEGSLTNYVRGICELFGENILSREISFAFISEPEDITGYFDRAAIDKIVFNLLSNAFKYTEKKGRIRVRLERHGENENERVRIIIEDNGQGIQEQLREKVFERFFQADHHHPGSGIGLSIVKSLTEMHHGTIQLESKLDQGSVFTVDIPIARDAYSDADISDRQLDRSADFTAFRPTVIPSTERQRDQVEQAESKPASILVVEDNPDMLNFISGIIQSHYRVMQALNAENALHIMESREPDMILTDLMMPGTGGMELVRLLKEDIRFTHIPIIIISAMEGKDAEVMGLRSGADDFIHKPFDPEVLLLKISNRLKSRSRFRREFAETRERSMDSQAIGQQDQEFLSRLMLAIDEHYANPSFGVKNLVQMMGMSHSVLLRKVKSLTGKSINELIVMIRLEKAHEVLRSENHPVKEVAYKVGFSDPKYFSTRFRKKYDCSPSELR